MKKLILSFATIFVLLLVSALYNPSGINIAYSQAGNSYELGVEYPEGGGSGCVALCGGPGSDCMIQGQFPVSCGPGNKK